MDIAVNAKFLTQRIEGIQRFALEISKELKRLRPEIRFVAPKGVLNKDIPQEFKVETYSGFKNQNIGLALYLKKTGTPLLINLTSIAPCLYKKQIVTIHDLSILEHPEWVSKNFFYFYKFLIPVIARNSLKIITPSNFSREKIIKILKIDPSRVEVVTNAVSKDFSPAVQKKDEIFFIKTAGGEKIRIQSNKYILTVSSLNPRKNLKRLVDAFNKLALKDIKLVIAGGGNILFSSKDNITGAKDTDNIIFSDYVEGNELVNLYRNALLFVYPSLYEGFGIPPLEAMACGCPVITSNITSLPETCGDAAFYVDPYNTDDIALGIHTLLNDSNLVNQLLNEGKERIKLFSWEKSARTILDIINNL
ncbi:glycosyltransferase family 4 protein [Candidatus Desantisbacteria bacterium]|nr:glycosyltransferase family 4 protein [Candidatus Desantisbacteria bacterium]